MIKKFNFNKLIIGTANFGQKYGLKNKKINQKEIFRILNYSHQIGIRTIDTANSYGNSEKILGKTKLKKWKVISKISNLPKNKKKIYKYINNSIRKSLKKLKVKKIYGLLIHNSDDLIGKNGNEIYENLIKLKQAGLISKIGVSIYNFNHINILIKRYKLDIIQLPFNIIDKRLIKKRLIQKLQKRKIEIHTRSIFLKGLLLKEKLPKKFKKWNYIWTKIKKFNELNSINNLSMCLQFIKNYSKIDNFVIGIDDINQLKMIVNEFNSKKKIKLPNIHCKNEELINPSKW